MGLIRLSDAIENLRAELKLAQDKGKGKGLQFNVGAIEIELEVVAESELGTSGKINWWILGGGVDTKDKDSSKHKLKLTLQPVEINTSGVSEPLKVNRSGDRAE